MRNINIKTIFYTIIVIIISIILVNTMMTVAQALAFSSISKAIKIYVVVVIIVVLIGGRLVHNQTKSLIFSAISGFLTVTISFLKFGGGNAIGPIIFGIAGALVSVVGVIISNKLVKPKLNTSLEQPVLNKPDIKVRCTNPSCCELNDEANTFCSKCGQKLK